MGDTNKEAVSIDLDSHRLERLLIHTQIRRDVMKTNRLFFVVVAIALLLLMVGCEPFRVQKPLSREQIEHTYQTVGLSSDACKADPNSQSCIDAWNKCTRNPKQDGCFAGYNTDPVTGRVVESFYNFRYQHNDHCSDIDVTLGDCPNYLYDPTNQ